MKGEILKSEFRKDIVSGEWVLLSSGRSGRPFFLKQGKGAGRRLPKSKCPFDDPQKSGNPPPLLWYPSPGISSEKAKKLSSWFVQVIPNKYPAVMPRHLCSEEYSHGPFRYTNGAGFHEVIITRDHSRTIAEMTPEEILTVLRAYRERYLMLKKETCLAYIFIFHNQGALAGASVSHPHSQLIALPIIPPDVASSLQGSRHFWSKNKKCVHCLMINWELKDKKRLIFQNEKFLSVAPYASRVSYEVRIFPKRHSPFFEEMSGKELLLFGEALKTTLLRVNAVLKKPDYNFFIHTSPLGRGRAEHYHWHLEFLPKTSQWAGIELGTGIELVSVFPEEAAKSLRGVKI